MKMRSTLVVATIVACALAPSAMAQSGGQMRGQGPGTGPVVADCQTEIEKFCIGLEHGGRAIRDCLEKNKDKVGAACRNALETTGPGRRWQ